MMIFITGLIASTAHVVTGPDHLAAVTPLAMHCHKKSWVVGVAWGIGHSLGMLLLGLLFILLKEVIPFDLISKHSDTVIGGLLILVGIWALSRAYLPHSHSPMPHPHMHEKPGIYAHIHSHSHHESHSHEHVHNSVVRQNSFYALGIGVVHGFAGFSHLLALLPSLAMPSMQSTVLYIGGFIAGTVIAMMLYALIIGTVAYHSFIRQKVKFLRWFTIAGGLLAILIGIIWIIHPLG